MSDQPADDDTSGRHNWPDKSDLIMLTLAIIHLETSVGPFRLTVSQAFDGTLVVERNGSEEPYGYPIKVGELDPTDAGRTEDANNLLEMAVRDIQSFAGAVMSAQHVPHLFCEMRNKGARSIQ